MASLFSGIGLNGSVFGRDGTAERMGQLHCEELLSSDEHPALTSRLELWSSSVGVG